MPSSSEDRSGPAPSGLTLHGAPRSRASMPRWYLEERAIPYHWHELDLKAGEHRQPPFLAINPFAKVPALTDHGFRGPDGGPLHLFENGAILLHLAENHGGDFADPVERSLAIQWVLFANSTLSIALFVPSNQEREFPALMTRLDALLEPDRPLVGDRWGVADCSVLSHLAYLPLFFPDLDLSPYPSVQACIAATRARPAHQRVMGAR
ncbi:glutathione S-transferase family protein [Synechococcus sp. RSCCF101]|uniref:glutathione S-transferase family protein n=1 Tax=Synechococcus sp. RSCCF101 TaxID=2511069 RepID=UPI001247BDBA|nr:glutathione S-transferase family protein [Synechococcus sp. RSCCF101]QEY31662.1 glutathione S-transferase family protein [Synechococcus sp. RSCCF101]